MPLTPVQQTALEQAILSYGYSLAYIDQQSGDIVQAPDRATHENYVRDHLLHENIHRVKHGLAVIIYWGNVNAGYAPYRTQRFLDGVGDQQLVDFASLVAGGYIPTLRDIKALHMPFYSAISFISKILMFLDPQNLAVLDLQISKIRRLNGNSPLDELVLHGNSIPITMRNSETYMRWCDECIAISNRYYRGQYRAVDVERGFFHLIGHDRIAEAADIYHDW